MRTFLITLVLLLLPAQAFGQGQVNFANNLTTRLATNDLQGHVGFTTGVSAYRIGFYMAPLGTADESVFSLVVPVGTNSTGIGDGLFNGNPLASFFAIPANTGQTIAFQIRAWSLFAGSTAEEAQQYNGPQTAYYGRSAIGFTLPEIGSGSPPNLFGTNPGQVGGFTLTPIIPEPSTWALLVLGAGVLWCATHARRRKTFPPPSRAPE